MPLSPRGEQVSDLLFANLSALATCLCESLDPVCRCDVTVGDQHFSLTGPDSDCDEECGEAWVRIISILPSPAQQTGFGGTTCFTSLRITLEVGVLRCLPTPEDATGPSEAEMAGVSSQQARDLVGAQEAILCCEHFDGATITSYTPLVDGNLVGGAWIAEVNF